MKKIIFYIVAGVVSLSSISCTDWLDITPKSEVRAEDMFKKESGFRDALMGIYTTMNTEHMYGAFETCLMDCMAGLVQSCGSSSSYMLNFQLDGATLRNRFANMWLKHYYCIANVNELLYYVDEVDRSIFNPGVYELVKGEALALRGFLHLDLIRMWGPVPTDEYLNRQSVPYYKEATVHAQAPVSLSRGIELVVEDLLAARDLLREVDPVMQDDYTYKWYLELDITSVDYETQGFMLNRNYRMNYYAATAAIARAYHHIGKKQEAAVYAKEVINSGKFPLYDSADVFNGLNQWMMKENIFQLYKRDLEDEIAIKFYFKESTAAATNNRLNLYRTLIFPSDVISRDWRAINLFSGTLFIKYNNLYSAIPILKSSEMYLIAADADNSFDYLNELRAHRGFEGIVYDDVNHVLQDELEAEYLREFLGEGQGYYFYKRTGKRTLKVNSARDHTVFFELEYPDVELEYGFVQSKEDELKELNGEEEGEEEN